MWLRMDTSMAKFFNEQAEQSQVKAAIVSKYFWAWANTTPPGCTGLNRWPRRNYARLKGLWRHEHEHPPDPIAQAQAQVVSQAVRRLLPTQGHRAHLPTYISGQISDIPEKSVEPIALNAGVARRTLQEFLSQHHSDHDLLRDRLQHIVRDEHSGPHSIGVIDETSDVKKGDKTPGVQRQWCGSRGKTENCLVTVHLGTPATASTA